MKSTKKLAAIQWQYNTIESLSTIALWRVALLVLLCIFAPTLALAKPGDKILNRPYADQKRMHLGFSVGMHFQDLKFTHNGYIAPQGEKWVMEVPGYSPGFCVNVLGDLRLHQYFNLRVSPGMYFGSKTVEMIDFNSVADGPGSATVKQVQDVKSAYVVVPIELKISGARYHNSRPYVTVGGMATFDVSKKRSEPLMFNTSDFYLTVGMGCDFYLPFFKLNPEIKFCFGLTDVLKHDRPDLVDDPIAMDITKSLKKVKSNMIVLTFYFE
ncbi:MAG: PorT family protein [Clostridium sp.]|nr:PorT family protein [Prevotella sp.]MCM1429574.1 PorT family protein [Clostridium sp.]MCM1476019.1 PorT family protein [Muribaculaceae bacterium]